MEGRHMTVRNIPLLALLVPLLVSATAAADAPRSALEARVEGLKSTSGKVGCLLYGSERGFPTDPGAASQSRWCQISTAKAASCQFDDVAAGTYAIACFHDENNNDKLDTGLFGIPTEGVGVSNGAKGFMGPPKFRDARFSYSGHAGHVPIRIAY
jgi:uncharacterized protein (DUF2141 family)